MTLTDPGQAIRRRPDEHGRLRTVNHGEQSRPGLYRMRQLTPSTCTEVGPVKRCG